MGRAHELQTRAPLLRQSAPQLRNRIGIPSSVIPSNISTSSEVCLSLCFPEGSPSAFPVLLFYFGLCPTISPCRQPSLASLLADACHPFPLLTSGPGLMASSSPSRVLGTTPSQSLKTRQHLHVSTHFPPTAICLPTPTSLSTYQVLSRVHMCLLKVSSASLLTVLLMLEIWCAYRIF